MHGGARHPSGKLSQFASMPLPPHTTTATAPPGPLAAARPEAAVTPRILIVDDERANVRLLERLLAHGDCGEATGVTDPREVLAIFHELEPDLVLLDLHMPHLDGFALLRALRAATPADEYLPILMLTGDGDRSVREQALQMGANDFVAKPFELSETLLRIRNLLETRRLHRALGRENRTLEERVTQRTLQLQEAQLETLRRLAQAAEFRDDDTGQHTQRVGELSARLAQVAGLDDEMVSHIRLAAPLHDIGKIGIPDAILLKPGKLTPEEFAVMQRHTTIGAAILADGQSSFVQVAETIALAHHERWDGGGYPHGLSGAEIPLAARIVGIADFFDALTHERPYRGAVPRPAVIELMREGSGRHFDPDLLGIFLDSIQDGREEHCVLPPIPSLPPS